MTNWDVASSTEILEDIRRFRDSALVMLGKPYRATPIYLSNRSLNLLRQYCLNNHIQYDQITRDMGLEEL